MVIEVEATHGAIYCDWCSCCQHQEVNLSAIETDNKFKCRFYSSVARPITLGHFPSGVCGSSRFCVESTHFTGAPFLWALSVPSFKNLLSFFLNVFIFMFVCVLPACMSVQHINAWCVWDTRIGYQIPLGLELEIVVSCHADTWNHFLWKISQCC